MNALRLSFVLLLIYKFGDIDGVPFSKNIEKDSNLDSNRELFLNVVRNIRDAGQNKEKGDDSQERDDTSSEDDSRERNKTAKSTSSTKTSSKTTSEPPRVSSPIDGWRTDENGCIIPVRASDVCPNGYGYYQHTNPKKFCQCSWWTLYVMPCAPGTAWNQALLTCVHDYNPQPTEDWRTDTNGCIIPITVSEVCPNGCGYYQHINPKMFCQCSLKTLYVIPCTPRTEWNQALLTCTPVNQEPSGYVTVTPTVWRTNENGCIIPINASEVCPNGYGYYPHTDPEKFCQCSWTTLYVMPCAPGTVWNQAFLTCVHGNQHPKVSVTTGTPLPMTSRTTVYQEPNVGCNSTQIGWKTDANGCITPVIDLCPNGYGYYEHTNPEKFCQCFFQYLYVMPCAPGTSWDQSILTCTRGQYQERIGSCSIGDVKTTPAGELMVCIYITNSAGKIIRDWRYCGQTEGNSTTKDNDIIRSSTTRSTSSITPLATNTTTCGNRSTTSTTTMTTTPRSSTKSYTCGSAPNLTGLLALTPGVANVNDKKVYRCENPDETFPRNAFNPNQCPVITCQSDGTYDKTFRNKAKTCQALPNSPPGDDTQTSPGTITSPGFNGNSPYSSTKADYRWNIVTTGSQIIFNITTFDVRNGNKQCNNGDRLEIFCGFKDSSREFKLCSGSPPGSSINCSVGCAGVVFVVDDKTKTKGVGFSFSWTN
ncbi:hypothetical protein CHS0354_019637 [Potamilus streckersoni]|uniref:CUB domain-containing protein n=1 Tax=Potamilus streckersoni TaxID=2493646 RepID=A0AAE0T8Y4_9BIVA|nr:hypothetical protein CHS0354_019637 [Potamilus streckersoni]